MRLDNIFWHKNMCMYLRLFQGRKCTYERYGKALIILLSFLSSFACARYTVYIYIYTYMALKDTVSGHDGNELIVGGGDLSGLFQP